MTIVKLRPDVAGTTLKKLCAVRGQAAASEAVVCALFGYVCGGEPQVELEHAFELLHLSDACNLSELALTIEAALHDSLDSAPVTAALKVLQLPQDLRTLKVACEDKVAANFEKCIDLEDFLELEAGQLGRILRRPDLTLSREEVVVKGIFQWRNKSKDRGVNLGLLLQHVDFPSLCKSNLAHLRYLSASMGPVGFDLERELEDAQQVHKKRSAERIPDAFRPKRRCLQHWSPELGASSQTPRRVLQCARSMCCHDGAIYFATSDHPNHPSTILCWKPADPEGQVIAGRGARVSGVNDLGGHCTVSVSPDGTILVADIKNRRLLSFRNGVGNVVLRNVDVFRSCSASGVVYILTGDGRTVKKLVGVTLQPVISSDDLPEELEFGAEFFFVTKDEVVYISDSANSRVLRLNHGEAKPVVVGEAPNKESSDLCGLFMTEDEKIYVADAGQRKVWAFHPGDAAWTEVLTCPGALYPMEMQVMGKSLYVSMVGVYEYLLPPKLQLG
eukprot:Skav206432  [mRNA]  locus=scaffold295:15128:16633:+ [translate_table: standard]